MTDWRAVRVPPSATIRDTIGVIDRSAMQIALVVDEQQCLLGTVTDGDVRRGILRGVELESPVTMVMNAQPKIALLNEERGVVLAAMQRMRLRHLPIVDESNRLVGLQVLDELVRPSERPNKVVLMAGGRGTRLQPLTEECPKPMLHVGGRVILETILLSFLEYGFRNFYFAVNHKAEVIVDHFGDGSRWGARIQYLHENKRLGTAGALGLLPERPQDPIVVMNGDVLTKVNFSALLEFHAAQDARATMCVREYEFQVPYGVIKIDGHQILRIEEKPSQKFFVNAGIYVLDPQVLDCIAPETFLDMTTLFETLVSEKQPTAVFPVREYWLDIGQHADFARANGEFAAHFAKGTAD